MKNLFIIISLLGILGYVCGQVINKAIINEIDESIRKINSLSGKARAQEMVRLYDLFWKCDDPTNNMEFNNDGGDCCGDIIHFCEVVFCSFL